MHRTDARGAGDLKKDRHMSISRQGNGAHKGKEEKGDEKQKRHEPLISDEWGTSLQRAEARLLEGLHCENGSSKGE